MVSQRARRELCEAFSPNREFTLRGVFMGWGITICYFLFPFGTNRAHHLPTNHIFYPFTDIDKLIQ
jgi:hypothetical protein